MDAMSVSHLFNPLFQRFDTPLGENDEAPLLAHYTSIQTLEHMLEKQEAWFSNPLFMNDHEEIIFGMTQGTQLFRAMKDIGEAAGSQARTNIIYSKFDALLKQMDDEDAFDIYAFCLSRHDKNDYDGQLSMWRGYGGQGSGAAVVFDAARIPNDLSSPINIAQVTYGSQIKRRDTLISIIKEWCQIIRDSAIADELLDFATQNIFELIKLYALTSKHDGFSEEKEIRLVYLPTRDPDKRLSDMLSYRIGAAGVEPKLKLKVYPEEGRGFPKTPLCSLIDRIILGPSVSSPLAKKSFGRMLENIKRPELVPLVYSSEIPLRTRP